MSSENPTSLARNIQMRLVADLFYHAKGVIAGTLVLVAINFAFYATKLPLPIIAIWTALMLASCLIRGLSLRHYERTGAAGSPRNWHREILIAYVVMALGWGLLSLSSVLFLSASNSIVAIVTVAGITGSAAATTSASPTVFKAVAYLALAPLAIALLFSSEHALPYVGGMSAAYLVVLNRASARIHETFYQSVRFGLENESLVQSLAYQSTVDSLTGLSNRRALNQGFQDAWASAAQQTRQVGLMLCDIDHFKEYNDYYGHLEGDRCLTLVAKAIQSATRSSDVTTARYGGEEFAVLLPNCQLEELEQISERLRQAVESLAVPHEKSSAKAVVTISVGASYLIPIASTNEDALIKAADKALYQAKERGRNCVQLDHELAAAAA